RKIITIRIFDREEYEKECSFSLVLEEPKWLRRGLKGPSLYQRNMMT
ncbi:solute carrier family 8 (sodium/calcium exchanger), member 1, isoform CRA_e, partial [Mus musculus]